MGPQATASVAGAPNRPLPAGTFGVDELGAGCGVSGGGGVCGDGRVGPGCDIAEEGAFLRWTVGVDAESQPMYHDVVVEPAQCGEVVGVMCAAVGSEVDVVDLEPVAGVAAGDGATTVAMSHEAPHLGWDGSCGIRSDHGSSVRDPPIGLGPHTEDAPARLGLRGVRI